MGGKAFSQANPEASFPRMAPARYQSLRDTLKQRLQTLFRCVATPAEAPEKEDHGDIDFLVCDPVKDAAVLPEDVRDALGAALYIPMPANRTSNYALRADWTDAANDYYQVDVHICDDRAEFARIIFFHSYGDLGMILGAISRNVGLAMSTHGLKVKDAEVDDTHPKSFPLSESFDDILPFFRLSMDRWNAGFSTQHEVFEWVATSRFFNPSRIPSFSKARTAKDRKMYLLFFEWAKQRASENDAPLPTIQAVVEEALDAFGKREEYYAIVKANQRRVALRKVLTGHITADHLGLDVTIRGKTIKQVMDIVRQDVGEDALVGMDPDDIKREVLKAKGKLDAYESQTRFEALTLREAQSSDALAAAT